MKKTAALVLVVTIILTVAACGEYGIDFGSRPDSNDPAQRDVGNALSESNESSINIGNTVAYNAPPKDLPENPVSDFEYTYLARANGVAITRYVGTALRVRIPEIIEDFPVTAIELGAFRNSDIVYAYIPNSVTLIEWQAFESCKNLASITIPNEVEYIGRGAFWGLSNLASIPIPDNLSIMENLLYSSRDLTSITIGDRVTMIDDPGFDELLELMIDPWGNVPRGVPEGPRPPEG